LKENPVYREVREGLNFKADCEKCKESIIISIGYNKSENEFYDVCGMKNQLICSNLKCKAVINPVGIKSIVLYKSVWKYECMLSNESKSQSGFSYNPVDNEYVTLDEDEKIKVDYQYLFMRVIKKESAIQKTSENEISSGLNSFTNFLSTDDTFNKKIADLKDFKFKPEGAIVKSNH